MSISYALLLAYVRAKTPFSLPIVPSLSAELGLKDIESAFGAGESMGAKSAAGGSQ